IARAQAHETLVRLELEIDLVAYIPYEPINPVIAVGRKMDAAVRLALPRRRICAHTQDRYCIEGQRKRRRRALVSTMPLHGEFLDIRISSFCPKRPAPPA